MGGGLLQLVAYGAQDVYLTGNPQITFFKVVYRRHTNFAIESIQQTFNGISNYGSQISVTVSRNGDLINRAYLQVNVPKIPEYKGTAVTDGADPRYVNYYGLRLLKEVVVEIGGQQIDKHYSDWMYIWNELSLPMGKKQGYENMVGANGDDLSAVDTTMLYIPLEFWFCRNVGLALPLIALQYHEVKFKILFDTMANCVHYSSAATSISANLDASLWIDYIFLDTDERRRFAQLSHEYLIEQLQFTGQENISSSGNNRYKLNFNHPCKELIWVSKNSGYNCWYNYTTTDNIVITEDNTADTKLNTYNDIDGKNPLTNCLLQLNGNDRFAVRKGSYFNYVQPYQHHTNIPSNRGINVYSFALKPEEHQPSGTLNMSRIDTAVLSMETQSGYLTGQQNGTINIYAVNYNVLRIMSGMGGLAYSN